MNCCCRCFYGFWKYSFSFFGWNKCELRILFPSDDLRDLQSDFFSGSGGWEKGGGRWMILNCYLKNRLRFHWSFVQTLQQNPFQFRIHKTPSERHRARNKFGYSKKNVSEECFTVNTAKKRRRRRTNLHKEPEKWLMFLSLLFASPSRLICLSRQTHQQLFFRGDRLLNTLLEHTLKRTRREITRNSLETKKSIKNY